MTFVLPIFKHHQPVRRNPHYPLLFLHIPKSAGTSLATGIQNAIHPNSSIIGGLDGILFGHFTAFSEFSSIEASRVYVGQNHLPAQADLVTGHFSYSHLTKVYPRGQVITILREPTSRLLSHWLFWRSHNRDELAGVGSWADIVLRAYDPLGKFLNDRDIYCQTDNLSVRMLLSPHPLIPVQDPIDPHNDTQLLMDAQKTLKRFAFVDVLENSDMAKNLQDWLGVPFQLPHSNATRQINIRTSLCGELDSETLSLLETRTRLDRVLWHEIVRRQQPGINSHSLERNAIMRSFSRSERLLTGGT